MFTIHEITPAPWGDDYRLVASFNTKEDAELVLQALNKVNFDFCLYKIVDWTEPKQETDFETEIEP